MRAHTRQTWGVSVAASAKSTIRSLLDATRPWLEKRGVDNPRLDAELLLAHALGMKRLDLYLDLDRPLADAEVARCRELVARRGRREPVAHIVGMREFWGLPMRVTADVLVPRPETERIVELVLERIDANNEGLFADACTGSGCLAIALLCELEGMRGIATDLSARALAVAAENARAHGVADRLELLEGDLLTPCAGRELQFVVANPPYIRLDEKHALAPEVAGHEPALALFGEDADGLGHHRRLLNMAKTMVVDGGVVMLEIGSTQGAACCALQVDGFGRATLAQDLAGLDRVAIWQRTPR